MKPKISFKAYGVRQRLSSRTLDTVTNDIVKDSFDFQYLAKGHGEITTREPFYEKDNRPHSITIPLFIGNNFIPLLFWFGRKEVSAYIQFDSASTGLISFLKHTKNFKANTVGSCEFFHQVPFIHKTIIHLEDCGSLFISYRDSFTDLVLNLQTDSTSACCLVLKRNDKVFYEKEFYLLNKNQL